MILDILCEKCRTTLATIDTDDFDHQGGRDSVWVPVCDCCIGNAQEQAKADGYSEGFQTGYDQGWQEGKDDAMENY